MLTDDRSAEVLTVFPDDTGEPGSITHGFHVRKFLVDSRTDSQARQQPEQRSSEAFYSATGFGVTGIVTYP